MYVALHHVAGFHCLVEGWKACEEIRPKPKTVDFLSTRKERRRNIEQIGARKQTGTDVSDAKKEANT